MPVHTLAHSQSPTKAVISEPVDIRMSAAQAALFPGVVQLSDDGLTVAANRPYAISATHKITSGKAFFETEPIRIAQASYLNLYFNQIIGQHNTTDSQVWRVSSGIAWYVNYQTNNFHEWVDDEPIKIASGLSDVVAGDIVGVYLDADNVKIGVNVNGGSIAWMPYQRSLVMV